eukprot:SAG22_NODE_601_length_8666_cov_7.089413_8_plen_345_part_00
MANLPDFVRYFEAAYAIHPAGMAVRRSARLGGSAASAGNVLASRQPAADGDGDVGFARRQQRALAGVDAVDAGVPGSRTPSRPTSLDLLPRLLLGPLGGLSQEAREAAVRRLAGTRSTPSSTALCGRSAMAGCHTAAVASRATASLGTRRRPGRSCWRITTRRSRTTRPPSQRQRKRSMLRWQRLALVVGWLGVGVVPLLRLGAESGAMSVIWLSPRPNLVNEVSAESGAMSVIWLLWRTNEVSEVSAESGLRSGRRVAPLLCLFLHTLDRVRDRFCAGSQFLVEFPADTGGAPDLLVSQQVQDELDAFRREFQEVVDVRHRHRHQTQPIRASRLHRYIFLKLA